MKHDIAPPHAETLVSLGIGLARLRYDALSAVVTGMIHETSRQAGRDKEQDHEQLYALGILLLRQYSEVRETLERMFTISAKYMEEDLASRPRV